MKVYVCWVGPECMEYPGEYHKKNVIVKHTKEEAEEWVRLAKQTAIELNKKHRSFMGDMLGGEWLELMKAKYGSDVKEKHLRYGIAGITYDKTTPEELRKAKEIQVYAEQLIAINDNKIKEYAKKKIDASVEYIEHADYDELDLYGV